MKDEKLETPFSPLLHKKVEGLAWKMLSGSSVKVYVQLLIRSKRSKDGQIWYTYNQANKDCGMGKNTFSNAINQLSDCGFIDIISSGKYRKPNIYMLSERWRLYGTEDYLIRYESRGNDFFDTDDLDSE